jgi:hypothetical protein
MIPVLAGVAVVLVGLAIAVAKANREHAGGNAQSVARKFDLQAVGPDELVGVMDGVVIRIGVDAAGDGEFSTRVKADLLDVLPPGMAVHNQGVLGVIADIAGFEDIQLGIADLDDHLRIQGEFPDAVRMLLTQHQVVVPLRRVLGHSGQVTLDGAALMLRIPGRQPDMGVPWARMAAAIVRAFDNTGRPHWFRLAHRHVLVRSDDDKRLDGVVGGVTTRVVLREPAYRPMTVVSMDLLQPLPPGTTIGARRRDNEPKLGDLILDSGVTVHGDPSLMASLLCQDHVRPLVLEVIGGLGAKLTHNVLGFELPGRAGLRLETAIDEAVALVHALASIPDTQG